MKNVSSKKYLIIATLIILAIALLFLARNGFLFIRDVNTDQNLTIKISDPEGFDRSAIRVGSNYFRLLPAGDYNVSMYNDSSSYFEKVTVDNFFRSTEVNPSLTELSTVRFKGLNPEGCAVYDGEKVYSWPCQSRLSEVVVHSVASDASPSVKRPLILNHFENSFMTDDILSSVFHYDNTLRTLVQLEQLGEDIRTGNEFAFYDFGIGGNLSDQNDGIFLNFIDPQKSYKAKQDNSQLIVFDDLGTELYILESISDQSPQKINLTEMESRADVSLYGVRQSSYGIAFVYGNKDRLDTDNRLLNDSRFIEEDGTDQDLEQEQESSVIGLVKNGSNDYQLFDLGYPPRQVVMCGEELVCVLDKTDLHTYEISDNSLVRRDTVDNILQIVSSNESLKLVDKHGVLEIDPVAQKGNYQYLFGDSYTFCGITEQQSVDLLCIRDNITTMSHLITIEEEKDYDGIDRFVHEIGAIDGVSNVNTFNDFIFLSIDTSRFEGMRNPDQRIDEITQLAEDIRDKITALDLPDAYRVNIPFIE